MLRRRRSSNLFSIDHTMRNRRSLFPTYMFILTMILVYGYNVHKMQDEVSSKIVLQVSTTQRDGNEGHKKLIATLPSQSARVAQFGNAELIGRYPSAKAKYLPETDSEQVQ
eukprot:TRINITY_DN20533_c0_g1_i1.p1 TRINITY_DN20533_c0_g1~~TRINITY_DN20533_c0_g1_i1.p1  ORF type:complete len:111 (+),score=2.39 TRINITY_DN20533_c0_g1_i1:76-408(+)